VLQHQTSIILALAVLVSAAGLLAYWGDRPPEDIDGTVPTGIDVEVDALTAIRIERREDRVELVKEATGWMLVTPIEDRANLFLIDRLQQAMAGVSEGVLLEKASAEKMGLAPSPVASVHLESLQGEIRFDIGDRAPVGWHDYVRNAEGRIFAVGGNLAGEVGRKVDAYRHPGLVDLALQHVTAVRLESQPGTLDARKQSSGRWSLEGFGAADPAGIEDLLVAASTMKFSSFYHAPLESIEEPEFELEIVEGEDRKRLVFGEVTALGRLAIDTEGRAGFLDPGATAFLGQGPTDLGVRHVLDERLEDIGTFTVAGANGTRVYENGGGVWTNPDGGSVDVEACLDALAATALVYRLQPPAFDPKVLSTVTIQGVDFERQYRFHPVDEQFIAVVDTQAGGALRVARADYERLGDLCGVAAP
jgi:hypothetical protein